MISYLKVGTPVWLAYPIGSPVWEPCPRCLGDKGFYIGKTKKVEKCIRCEGKGRIVKSLEITESDQCLSKKGEIFEVRGHHGYVEYDLYCETHGVSQYKEQAFFEEDFFLDKDQAERAMKSKDEILKFKTIKGDKSFWGKALDFDAFVWTIVTEPAFVHKSPCTRCAGTGKRYTLKRRQEVECFTCLGLGYLPEMCAQPLITKGRRGLIKGFRVQEGDEAPRYDVDYRRDKTMHRQCNRVLGENIFNTDIQIKKVLQKIVNKEARERRKGLRELLNPKKKEN